MIWGLILSAAGFFIKLWISMRVGTARKLGREEVRASTAEAALKKVEQAQAARRGVDPSQVAIDNDPDNLDRRR